eukprot:6555886-Prorocentrum_lima.AAC.1
MLGRLLAAWEGSVKEQLPLRGEDSSSMCSHSMVESQPPTIPTKFAGLDRLSGRRLWRTDHGLLGSNM